MKYITQINFKICKKSLNEFHITLQTDEGQILAGLECQENKILKSSFDCPCNDERKQFYKSLFIKIFALLVKENLNLCCQFEGVFQKQSLDRVISVSTEKGECLLRGSSEYCYEQKKSSLSLKAVPSCSTIRNLNEVKTITDTAQCLASLFEEVLYA